LRHWAAETLGRDRTHRQHLSALYRGQQAGHAEHSNYIPSCASVCPYVPKQHARKALAVADRACILQRDRVVWSGSAGEARRNPHRIERAYLGQDATTAKA